MNNENTMNIFDESFIKNFDFSNDFSTFNNETNLDEEDDIIINNDNKFSFDESKLDDFKIGDLLTEDSDDLSDFEPVKINSSTKDNSTNLDSFFDSIYNGVEDANDLISQINLKKKTLFETEKEINSLKDQIAREKEEFSRYMELQRQALEIEKKQLKEKAELQKLRLSEEASQFKNDMEVKNNELELREQKVKVVDDNEIVLYADVVTGKPGTETDIGYTEVLSKTYNRPLTGPGYRLDVQYFIHFNTSEEGFHDNYRRNAFGEDIYLTNGSHGCVNMNLEDVRIMDEHTHVGTKVLVHK